MSTGPNAGWAQQFLNSLAIRAVNFQSYAIKLRALVHCRGGQLDGIPRDWTGWDGRERPAGFDGIWLDQ